MDCKVYKIISKPTWLLVLFVITILVSYQNTVQDLIRFWFEEGGDSHGILLFFVCVYLFYKKWKLLQNKLVISFDLTGVLLLTILVFTWFAANVVFVKYIELVSLPFILAVSMLSFIGWRQSKPLLFPILLLLLAGPLLKLLKPVLQEVTVVITGMLLDLVGVTSVAEGVLILVPAGTFEVDTECAGLNVITVGVIISLLYSYINYFKIKDTVVLVGISIVVSMLSNALRVSIVVIAGNETQMQHPLVTDHGDLGWVLFSIMIGVFLFLVHRYWPACKQEQNALEQVIVKSGSGDAQQLNVLYRTLGISIIFLLASAGPLLLLYKKNQTEKSYVGKEELYQKIGDWNVTDDLTLSWTPVYTSGKGDYLLSQTFINQNGQLIIFSKQYFSSQSIGNEAISVTNKVYDRKKWTRVWIQQYPVGFDAESDVVEETLIRQGSDELLVWRWYFANEKKTGNPYKAKLYNLLGVLSGDQEISVYIISTKVKYSYEGARKRLKGFVFAANNIIY